MKNYKTINCTICGEKFFMENWKYNHRVKHNVVVGWYCSTECKMSTEAKRLRYNHQAEVQEKKYGYRNVFQRKDVIEKIQSLRNEEKITEKKKNTLLRRYGVDNSRKINGIGERIKNTNVKKYGVEVAANSEKWRSRIEDENIIKYGVKNFIESDEFKKKAKSTLTKKYGTDQYLKFGSPSFKKLMLEKYGVTNCMHIPEFAERCSASVNKKSYQYKSLRLPSGKIIKYQGYENRTLNRLFDMGYAEDEIKMNKKNVPEIWYEYEGVKRRYYPDFFIPHKNLVIETKSKYTYEVEKEKNMKKFEATKALGYNILTDIY